MYQEILKKKKALEWQHPLPPKIRNRISETTRVDMLYGELLLEGTDLLRSDVENMRNGTLIKQASLGEYTFVQQYSQMLDLAKDWLEMGNQVDKKMMLKMHSVLSDKPSQFRRSNPAIERYRYVPVHQSKIEEQLSVLSRDVYRNKRNIIENAAHLHCDIIRIYPFETYTETIARLMMNFYLAEHGLVPVLLGYGYDEYTQTVKGCLQDKNESLFVRGLERAVYNKLDVVLQISVDLP